MKYFFIEKDFLFVVHKLNSLKHEIRPLYGWQHRQKRRKKFEQTPEMSQSVQEVANHLRLLLEFVCFLSIRVRKGNKV